MRGKKRYLAVQLQSTQPLVQRDVVFAVLSRQKELFGSLGLARQKLGIVAFNPQTGVALVKCELKELSNVKAGLLLLSRIGTQAVSPRLLQTSGSLSKLKEKFG